MWYHSDSAYVCRIERGLQIFNSISALLLHYQEEEVAVGGGGGGGLNFVRWSIVIEALKLRFFGSC